MLLHRVLPVLLTALAVVIVSPTPAHASQAREEVDLQTVVQAATAVVLAVPATPSQRSEAIAITPPGKRPDPEKYPPYVRRWQRWRVQEVLAGPPTLAGQVLEVDEAHWQMQLNVHRRYYLEGVNKIPIYQAYSPSYRAGQPPGDPARIVMLAGKPGAWRMAADNALESPQQRPQVQAALRKAAAPHAIPAKP